MRSFISWSSFDLLFLLYLIIIAGLFARLSEHSVGLIDWKPYLPFMFARIQQMFHLPVLFNKTSVGGKITVLDSSSAARWIVNTLGGESQTKVYLRKMFVSLESYFHPANFGR